MPKARHHYYLVTAMVAYMREDQPRQRHMNLVTQLDEKKITANTIDCARTTLLQRMASDGQVPPEDVRDIVFINFSHLGFMTEDEFQDMEPEKTQRPNPYDA